MIGAALLVTLLALVAGRCLAVDAEDPDRRALMVFTRRGEGRDLYSWMRLFWTSFRWGVAIAVMEDIATPTRWLGRILHR